MANLALSQVQFESIIGASLAVKDALAQFTPVDHTVQQHLPSSSLFRVLSGPTVISIPELILPSLLDAFIVRGVDLNDLLSDPYSLNLPPDPSAPDPAWIALELDLRAPWNLTLADSRAFLAGFIAPLVVRLLQLSSSPGDPELAQKLLAGIPYFRYLAVRAGFGSVSAAKRTALSAAAVAKKVHVLWGAVGKPQQPDADANAAHVGSEQYRDVLQQISDIKDDVLQLLDAGDTHAVNEASIQQLEGDLARVQQLAEKNSTAISELKQAHTAMGTQLSDFHSTLESRLVSTVETSLQKYTDIITAKITLLVSGTSLPAQPHASSCGHCDLQVHLCLHNPTPGSVTLVNTAPNGLHRAFTAGEPTDLVCRSVTRGLSASTPFIIAVSGAGAGGSLATIALLETVLRHLPDTEITVSEIAANVRYLCGFQHVAGTSARDVGAQIVRDRTGGVAHLLVSFEDSGSGRLYGVVLEMADETATLGNADWRRMVRELTTPGMGVAGFVRAYKAVSGLNGEVAGLLARMGGMPVVRVLCCVDGGAEEGVVRELGRIAELGVLV